MPRAGSNPDGKYVQFDGSINVGGDRNWRNNNPGNIEAGGFADSQGAIGSDGRYDTAGYTSFIAQNVGVDASTAMSDLTADQLASFADAIESFEGGAPGTTYQSGDTGAPSWVQDSFDGSVSDAPAPTASPTPSPTPDPAPDPPTDPVPTPLPGPTPDPTPDPSPDPTPDPPLPDSAPDPAPDHSARS